MKVGRLLLRQWRNRPGRAVATAASVAVAVGAVVATWVSADASRAGYRRLTEAVDGVPSIDISARGGGRWDIGRLPSLADIAGVRAVVPLFYRPTLLRVGERRVREIAVGVDAESLAAAGLLTMAAGRACGGADEVVLDAALAKALGKGIGDDVIFFARRGVRRADGLPWSTADRAAQTTLIAPAGAAGPLFLTFPNHMAIRRYNNSASYALAIGLTADGVAGKPGLVGTWPNDGPISREQRFGAQTALARRGYDPGAIDGVIGSGTRRALRQWQIANGRIADGYLTAAIADELMRGM
jgi:hypothetical protein